MPGESYVVIFALAERLSISATLHQGQSSLAKNGSKFDHTAPESVKRVKSIAQILDKSFFWRLSATNALGGLEVAPAIRGLHC